MLRELAFREARYFVHFLRGEVEAARAAADRLLAFADGLPTAQRRVNPHALDPLERIGSCVLVVDLFLLVGDIDRAQGLLDRTQVLCDALLAGGGNHYAAAHAVKRAWLALAQGRPADALARLPADDVPRLEDRFARAWIGAAAARRLGNPELAWRHLRAVATTDEVSTTRAMPASMSRRNEVRFMGFVRSVVEPTRGRRLPFRARSAAEPQPIVGRVSRPVRTIRDRRACRDSDGSGDPSYKILVRREDSV